MPGVGGLEQSGEGIGHQEEAEGVHWCHLCPRTSQGLREECRWSFLALILSRGCVSRGVRGQ